MASKPASTADSKSGVRQLSNGESVIPASTRADGTVRKEIKVKPGYKPPEDVAVYKNRTAESWKNRGKAGIPGAERIKDDVKDAPQSAAAMKNAKRKEARKKAATNAALEGTEGDEPVQDHSSTNGNESKVNGEAHSAKDETVDPDAEKVKEARKLTKKLREAQSLQTKKEEGESLLPEQLAKVIKIKDLTRQLDNLGFNSEGQRKDEHETANGEDGA